MAEDKEQRLMEAENRGQEDGARWRNAALEQTALAGLVTTSYYDPPNAPEEAEAYEAGFRNTAGPSMGNHTEPPHGTD